jgi:hypothetical protein
MWSFWISRTLGLDGLGLSLPTSCAPAHPGTSLQHYYNKFFEELANLGNQEQPWFSFDDLKKVCH